MNEQTQKRISEIAARVCPGSVVEFRNDGRDEFRVLLQGMVISRPPAPGFRFADIDRLTEAELKPLITAMCTERIDKSAEPWRCAVHGCELTPLALAGAANPPGMGHLSAWICPASGKQLYDVEGL